MLQVLHRQSAHSRLHLDASASPSWRPALSNYSDPFGHPPRVSHAPASGRAHFEAGFTIPKSTRVDEPSTDMTSYYCPTYQSAQDGDGSHGMRRTDNRYEAKDTTAYPYQRYPMNVRDSQPASRAASRAASPEFQPNPSYDHKRSGNSHSIHPYLQLPPTISPSGGSLTEFVAQTTCLFWFESSYTLARLEDPSYSPPSRSSLVPGSVPATGFLKWVTTILSTTQVTQNVVLLALLFVRRLKNQNPTVKGKPGSEYRLLTVALMLGNKFLDDNTYTNKTWAEVSGISVTEIHVMEVEFLSHMKYNLYTTKAEWEDWHKQLSSLWKFFNVRTENISPQVKGLAGRPMLHIPRGLPSPPGSTLVASPYTSSASPAITSYNGTPLSLPHLIPPTQFSSTQLPSTLDVPLPSRKRSWDETVHTTAAEPPFKRIYGHEISLSRSFTPSSTPSGPLQTAFPHLPSLPVPNPSAPAGLSVQPSIQAQLAPVSSTRTAAPTLPSFHWPSSSDTQRAGQIQGLPQSLRCTPPRAPPQFDSGGIRSSPSSNAGFSAVSSHTPAQHQLSPSYFLHQRSSPYRPVRDIRTLLGPAHSGQLQSQPQTVPQEHMYWQPLGRQSERQVGRVPYLHREAWPESNQFDGWAALQPLPNMHG